jgi:hypothetical protein
MISLDDQTFENVNYTSIQPSLYRVGIQIARIIIFDPRSPESILKRAIESNESARFPFLLLEFSLLHTEDSGRSLSLGLS